jgi:mannose-6-phosphate isomerase-like protein (cupin superfamily)
VGGPSRIRSAAGPTTQLAPIAAACFNPRMEIRQYENQVPFTTKDGSTIRSLLGRAVAPVRHQSLAEATLPAGGATQRHFHRLSEEFYYLLEGCGVMEIDGEQRGVGPGDAILIPAGAWHQIQATTPLRFLCCCAPPYAHEDTYFSGPGGNGGV